MTLRRFIWGVLMAAVCAETGTSHGQTPAVDSLPPDLWTRRTGHDWATFLGPTGDGKSAETGLVTPWPEAGPRLLWQLRVGVGYGMPAVSRGRMFQFDRVGGRARLTCYHVETTAVLWTFEYPTDYEDLYGYDNGPRGGPIVDDDRVYIYGAEGMLHCLRAVDGTLLWKVDTMADYGVVQNFFGVGSSPIVHGDLLIVPVGGSPPESAQVPPGRLDLVRPNGSAIVAFDKRTGKERYRTGDDLASYASPQVTTLDGRPRGLYFARDGLLAFDPSDGRTIFHFPWRAPILESVNASNAVLLGDRVFLSETYGPGSVLLRQHGEQYDVVWQDSLRSRDKRMQTHWNTAVEVNGFIYGSSGRHLNNAELRCIESTQGNVLWSEPGLTRSSLTYVDGHFICLTEDGEILLLKANPEKFDVVSRFTPTTGAEGIDPSGLGPPRLIAPPAWAAPIISHGLLLVRGKGRLACFEIIPDRAAP